MLQPSLLLGHVLVVSGDFTVTSIMTAVLCPATASALRENKGLTELSLVDCDIDAEGLSHLAQALCVNTTLRVLNLSDNHIDTQGAEHLGKLSGGVWGYGLTCNIRRCQCATSNREMSVVYNVNVDLRWSIAPFLRYCGPLPPPRLFFFAHYLVGRVGRGVCSNIQLVSCIHPPHINCVHVHCYNPLCCWDMSSLCQVTLLSLPLCCVLLQHLS